MTDCNNFNTLWLNTVDDSIVLINIFTKIFILIFRNNPTSFWEFRDELNNLDNPSGKKSGIIL